MNRRTRYFALRVLVAHAFCLAGIAFGYTDVQTNSKPDLSIHLTIMEFTLEKSTLAHVQAKLGRAALRKCSHDEESSKEECYVSAAKDRTKVVFEAGFSGGWKELDGFKVIAGSVERRCYRQCRRTAQLTGDVQTKGGLRLGLTREQLLILLGAPKQVRGNKLS